MRYNLLRRNSTKAERRFYEILKELHIPFKHRFKLQDLEIDFIVKQYAIDIDGHNQNGLRNHKIASLGFVPIHFSNLEIILDRNNIKNKLKEIYEFNSIS